MLEGILERDIRRDIRGVPWVQRQVLGQVLRLGGCDYSLLTIVDEASIGSPNI